MLVTDLCPACGHELTQKNRLTLALTGITMLILSVPLVLRAYIWPLAILLGATGLYLLMWSVFGKGRWCRRCKKFPVSKKLVG
jgi:hypothetical protein